MNSCLQFSHAISTVNLFETPSCCPLEFMKLLIQSACTLGKGSIKKTKKIHIHILVWPTHPNMLFFAFLVHLPLSPTESTRPFILCNPSFPQTTIMMGGCKNNHPHPNMDKSIFFYWTLPLWMLKQHSASTISNLLLLKMLRSSPNLSLCSKYSHIFKVCTVIRHL